MTTLFISDLHLHAGRPDITGQFLDFLREEAPAAEALYILGDLFEAWIGDDDPDPHHRAVVQALRTVVRGGVPGYFMRGNRDFLIGDRFAAETGFTILEDPDIRDIHGTRVLISHGDAYCTDDTEYQAFRQQVRQPAWQAQFLAMPIEQRLEMAGRARAESRASTAQKAGEIMDVNQQAVELAMREAGVDHLLHGHTHRPGVHEFSLDGRTATRIVLGDWYEQGSVLRWDEQGFELDSLPRATA